MKTRYTKRIISYIDRIKFKREPEMKVYEEILFDVLKELLKTKENVSRAEWSAAAGNKRHEGFRQYTNRMMNLYGDSIIEYKIGKKFFYKLKE